MALAIPVLAADTAEPEKAYPGNSHFLRGAFQWGKVLETNDFLGGQNNAGVPIDAIGIQSHMHMAYRGAKWAWETCERFARLGKPLHFTELTILSGDLKTDSDWELVPTTVRRRAGIGSNATILAGVISDS